MGAVAVRRAARKLAKHKKWLSRTEELEEENMVRNGGTRIAPRPLERKSVERFHMRATSGDNDKSDRNMEEEVL